MIQKKISNTAHLSSYDHGWKLQGIVHRSFLRNKLFRIFANLSSFLRSLSAYMNFIAIIIINLPTGIFLDYNTVTNSSLRSSGATFIQRTNHQRMHKMLVIVTCSVLIYIFKENVFGHHFCIFYFYTFSTVMGSSFPAYGSVFPYV